MFKSGVRSTKLETKGVSMEKVILLLGLGLFSISATLFASAAFN